MSKITFVEGLEVYYKDFFGVVKFVCDQYITVCIQTYPNERVKDLCLLVYPPDYHLVTLQKESTK